MTRPRRPPLVTPLIKPMTWCWRLVPLQQTNTLDKGSHNFTIRQREHSSSTATTVIILSISHINMISYYKEREKHHKTKSSGWITVITLTLLRGWWGRCEKKTISGRRKEGRVEKKSTRSGPPDPGLEPGTCRVLGEGPPLHARGAV